MVAVTEALVVQLVVGVGLACLAAAVLATVALFLLARAAPPSCAPPAAFVINLPGHARRMDAFKDAYRASDMRDVTLLRVDAFDGGAVDWSTFASSAALEQLLTAQRTGVPPARADLTPGAVGQYLSHMEAWRSVARSGARYGFVFEDTARVPRDLLARFERVLAQVPRGWDVVMLGYEGEGEAVGPDAAELVDGLEGHHAYAISARAARRLYKTLLPIDQRLSDTLTAEVKAGRLRAYGAREPVPKAPRDESASPLGPS